MNRDETVVNSDSNRNFTAMKFRFVEQVSMTTN